jgi:hypothetical protein
MFGIGFPVASSSLREYLFFSPFEKGWNCLNVKWFWIHNIPILAYKTASIDSEI